MENDLRKRDPRNAPGPFYAVEKLCLSCGLPESEAPNLLANLDGAGGDTFSVKQPATTHEIEQASFSDQMTAPAESMSAWPCIAGDGSPAILRRLQKVAAVRPLFRCTRGRFNEVGSAYFATSQSSSGLYSVMAAAVVAVSVPRSSSWTTPSGPTMKVMIPLLPYSAGQAMRANPPVMSPLTT